MTRARARDLVIPRGEATSEAQEKAPARGRGQRSWRIAQRVPGAESLPTYFGFVKAQCRLIHRRASWERARTMWDKGRRRARSPQPWA